MIEFVVDATPIRENETHWMIVGRCLTDVHIGTSFKKAIFFSLKYETSENAYKQTRTDEFHVTLIVEKIFSWDRDWEVISAGMAAKLLVCGDASKILERTLLVDEA